MINSKDENRSKAPSSARREFSAPPSDAVGSIMLLPRRVVAGIWFHVLDEALADRMDDASADRRIHRLEREGICLTIAKNQWELMSNPERLHWLLSASETDLFVRDDGLASLGPRRR